MTRNDNRNGIAVVRHPDSAKSARMPDSVSDIAVTASLSIRDVKQLAPALQLKIGAAQVERERKVPAMPGEIFVELTEPRGERWSGLLPGLICAFSGLVAVELQLE